MQAKLDAHIPQLTAWGIRSVLVLRGGEKVWAWQPDMTGSIYSCTKTVLAALLGIALGRGELTDVNVPVLSFFPKIRSKLAEHHLLNARKESITLKHLLTMTSGLDWPEFDKKYFLMRGLADPGYFVLAQAAAHEPGKTFAYNSGGSYLLSMVLEQETGMAVHDYARKYLFDPLNFRRTRWNRMHGVEEGGTGLSLHTIDMAKFGQLLLQEGRMYGEQVVPASWIADMVRVHSTGYQNYRPPIFGSYGYHLWISPAKLNGVIDYYFALGFGGQYLFVIPALEAVVIVRKQTTRRQDSLLSRNVLHEMVLPVLLEGV